MSNFESALFKLVTNYSLSSVFLNLNFFHLILSFSMSKSKCKWMIISFTSDWLYPPYQSFDIVDALLSESKNVSYCNIKSNSGHDAFLLSTDIESYGELLVGL